MKAKLLQALEDKDFFELIKGGGISFLLRFVGLAVGYILTLVISNLFGSQGLGDYVLIITVLAFFSLLAKMGLDIASIRFIASYASKKEKRDILYFRKKTLIIISLTSLVASLCMYFFSNNISTLINANARFLKLSSFFIFPLTTFMLNYESLRGLKRIAEFSFFYRVSIAFFALISLFIIYQFNKGSEVPVYAYLSSTIIASILSFFSFQYWVNINTEGTENIKKKKLTFVGLLKISIPLMLAQSIHFVMVWMDKLLLGNMASVEEVGIYYTAFKLSMFAAVALMSVNSIAAPKFAELYAKGDLEGLKQVAHQSTRIIFWTSLPLVIIFFIFPEFFLGFFGDEFKTGVTAFIILSSGRLVSSFCGSVGSILQMTDNQNIYVLILLMGVVINIALNLLIIPKENPLSNYGISGINGAAFAFMCSMSFWNLAMVFIVKKRFGFYTFYIPFLKNEN